MIHQYMMRQWKIVLIGLKDSSYGDCKWLKSYS